MQVPEVVAQAHLGYLELRYWFFSYVVYLDYSFALKKYERDNRIKLVQVAAVRIASKEYGGKEVSEAEARRQFDLADPPKPFDGWQGMQDTGEPTP